MMHPSIPWRQHVEDFLYEEARLLDAWRLTDWLGLLTSDCTYEVPATDALDGDPTTCLAIVADDYARICQRVAQLNANLVWCEYPRSRTRRIVGNVVVSQPSGPLVQVRANFIIHRFVRARADVFVGRYEHTLLWSEETLRMQKRKTLLDHVSLISQGQVTIIL
jgi:3-phenylpropionate/trans-cinnamate dioxygenase beta subunit/p-cumate 2,3-dioxygenase beta subunit